MYIFVQRATRNGQPIIVFKQQQTNKPSTTNHQQQTKKHHLSPGGQLGKEKSFFY